MRLLLRYAMYNIIFVYKVETHQIMDIVFGILLNIADTGEMDLNHYEAYLLSLNLFK
jgi:hypothetical protein